MPILLAAEGAVSQGILWSLMTLGVYLSFRILDAADLTGEGSFATGGAVTAVLITKGMDPFISLLFVFIVGAICGLITGLMNAKLKINILLAGILTQIALYSINIRIMGKANIPLIGSPTMMFKLKSFFGGSITITTSSLIIGFLIVLVIVAFMYWFFGTEFGNAIRATGVNKKMARALGVNTDAITIIGLMISNGIIALSGALVAQSQGYADVSMGLGSIVIGLASIVIGEVLFGSKFGFLYALISIVVGSIIYRIVIAIVLQLGLKPTDMKLLTALIVAISLSFPVLKEKLVKKNQSN